VGLTEEPLSIMVQFGKYSVAVVDPDDHSKVYPEDDDNYICMPDKTQYALEICNGNDRLRVGVKVVIDERTQGRFLLEPGEKSYVERPVGDKKRFTCVLVRKHGKKSGHAPGETRNGHIQVVFTPEAEKEKEEAPVKSILQSSSNSSSSFFQRPFKSTGDKTPSSLFGTPVASTGVKTTSSLFGTSVESTGFRFGSSNTKNSNPFGESCPPVCFGGSPPAKQVFEGAPSFGVGETKRKRDGESSRAAKRRARPDYQEAGTALTGSSKQTFNAVAPPEWNKAKRVTINLRLVGKPKAADITPLRNHSAKSTPIPPPVGRAQPVSS